MLIEILVLFLLVLVFSVRFSTVQTFLANQVVTYFTNNCNSTISIKKLDTDFFHFVRIKGVDVKDETSATLLKAETIWLGFHSLISLKDSINLSDLVIETAELNIKTYKNDSIDNMSKFIQCFPSQNSGGSTNMTLTSLELSHVNFSFQNENKLDAPSLGYMSFNNLNFSDLNVNAENISLLHYSFEANNVTLNFTEQSGFKIEEFTSQHIFINKNELTLNDLHLQTNNSKLELEDFKLAYSNFQNFNQFNDSVLVYGKFYQSELAFNDLKYFYKALDSIDEVYHFRGEAKGTINELSISKFSLEKQSNINPLKFKGSGTITGLSDVKNAFFNLTADYLETNKNGVENLQLLKLGSVRISLPYNTSRLGNIVGKGFFRGYIQGFVSEFDFETNLGNITTDLNFYFDEYNKNMVYDGNIITKNFDVGNLYQVNKLGKVTGNVSINASGITIDKLKTTIEGKILEIFYNNYTYKNIGLNGVLEKNFFNGNAHINDKNLVAYYDGNIDFKSKVPSYNFCMSINKANLFPLNIRHYEDAFLSLNVDVKGSGFDFENLNGEFGFNAIEYKENGREYLADSIIVSSNLNKHNNSIKIWSGVLDASLEGKYNLKELPQLIQEMASKVLPKKINSSNYEITEEQNITFDFNLKDISAITHLFVPDLIISKNASIKGDYSSVGDYLGLKSNIDFIEYKGVRMNGVLLETQLSEIFEVQVYLDSLQHLDNTIKNVDIFSAVYNDNIGIQFKWKDEKSNGEIAGNGYWNELAQFKFDLDILNVNTPHQEWSLKEVASITQIDSLRYNIDAFELSNKNQLFTLEGVLGDNYSDVFTIRADSVQLNDVIPIKSYTIEGKLDAHVQIRNALKSPMILGRLSSDIIINKVNFGRIEAQSWMTSNDTVKISAELNKLDKQQMTVEGNYLFKNDSPFDIDITLSKLNIEPINIFLPNAVKNLKGQVTGDLHLTGNTDQPNFEGRLVVEKGNIKVNVLNTEYTFEGEVEVTPDLIYTEGAKAYDIYGNQANILSASFYHQYFREYSYDFSVHMFEPILALNTTIEDNSLFYGKAFATGFANISYDKYNLTEIQVEATSHKGTEITLPLYGSEEVSIGEFISFTKFSDSTINTSSDINLTGISMNFNLTATPDAKIKMVFDELVGDEITAYGNGNIYMEIDQYDQFKMYGQYELEKGEYLFTLKDLINKKFDLNKGGTVSWYGDPYNAEINIDAVYNIKASVADLFPLEEKLKYPKQEVDCHMVLTNSLFSPNIGFEIALPKSSDQVKTVVQTTINTKEELERQFFSLLLLNKFVPRQSSSLGSVGSGVSTSTSELLTNQVNQILNKWIEGVDVGINYNNGGGTLTNEEYALALSTQLFSEKLLLSGNFGVSQNRANKDNSTVIGDVNIEYIIDEQGVWRLKAFNQSNTYDPTKSYQGNYTQGVGITYQKSFDTLNEIKLWEKFSRIFAKPKEENE